jgi:hypothetical protein
MVNPRAKQSPKKESNERLEKPVTKEKEQKIG